MKKIFTAVVVVLSLALCSVAAAAVSSSLNGTYKTTVHSTVLAGALNGTWTLKLKNGAYHVADNGHPIVHGKYTIKGSKISLKDTGGTGRCPGAGTYKFKVSGTSVTMTKVHDSKACIGRETVLTSGPLTKVS